MSPPLRGGEYKGWVITYDNDFYWWRNPNLLLFASLMKEAKDSQTEGRKAGGQACISAQKRTKNFNNSAISEVNNQCLRNSNEPAIV